MSLRHYHHIAVDIIRLKIAFYLVCKLCNNTCDIHFVFALSLTLSKIQTSKYKLKFKTKPWITPGLQKSKALKNILPKKNILVKEPH